MVIVVWVMVWHQIATSHCCNYVLSVTRTHSIIIIKNVVNTLMFPVENLLLTWSPVRLLPSWPRAQKLNTMQLRRKWSILWKQYFQMHFREWKLLNFNWNFIEICSWGPIDNISSRVQIIIWHWTGNKPLSETMMNPFLDAHICITWSQWINVVWCHIFSLKVFIVCVVFYT